MNQVKHRIYCDLLDGELPLLFYRNALSLENRYTDKSTPVQLCYPDMSITLGFHPHSFNLYQQLNLDAEGEGIFERPSLIVSTECKDFNNIRADVYRWGIIYVICTSLLLMYILKIIMENQVYVNDIIGIKINKSAFHIVCLLVSLSPLLAVIERCPFFMFIYKALFPSILIIILLFFLNEVWDLLFILLLSIARLSISSIQYKMVSSLFS
ncbi:uncharacterized protein cubi_02928 [Cryptosporidium ubiquitum]|uniref:Uncharacterized protein n=1 Tax=Cryptosporidium ubiquitum TaxID=857276 RepID=A0A1J4MIV5_9CRYT|nr:uncharacterized protein cubi_02928 [Cryptosporidium ubiquitum]OII74126.1 hypothetical protein cubi_02928 [Cryptosporidium ubiquitum]